MENSRKAILVVSFGTSYPETREKTIDQIEKEIGEAYPEYTVYRAWTSGMIRKKLLERDGIFVADVRGALEQMKADGIADVVVQPTHVLNGIENDLMLETVLSYKEQFAHLVVGSPLLTSQQDQDRVTEAVAKEFCPALDEALVFMGHGTEHFANTVYAALDYQFKDMGYRNIFMGTVEAYPSFESLLKQVQELQPKQVILAPFMIVAGDHATNDLSGEEEDSWKSRFEEAGFSVRCVLKGLGEYPAVRKIFLDHVAAAVEMLEKEQVSK